MTDYNQELFQEFQEDPSEPDDYVEWLEKQVLEDKNLTTPLLMMWIDFISQNKHSHTHTGEFLDFLSYDYKGNILSDIRYLITGKREK